MDGRRYSWLRAIAFGALLVLAVSSAACAGGNAGGSRAPERDQVRISGSGTCLPLLRFMTEQYGESEDTDFLFLPGLHSGGGIQGVAIGDLELGSVSRDLTDDERLLDLDFVLLSTDGLAIATHPSVGIEGLTTEQLRDIYRGKYRNWKELGGPDLPLVVLDRNEDESAKMILRRYVLGDDLQVTDRAVSLYYESDMVSGLERTAGAIGYFSLGYAISQGVEVDLLELDGVAPTVENVANGTYPVVRPLGVVARKDAPAAVKRFLEWATSEEARDLIAREGYAYRDSAR